MADEGFDEEVLKNLYQRTYNLYLEDALDERGLTEAEMYRAQILFIAPFKDTQFDLDIHAEKSAVDVRINEEVEAELMVRLDPEAAIEPGDKVRYDDIDDFGNIVEIPDFGTDVGHVSIFWFPDGSVYAAFDFGYNESYLEPLIEAADEFIELATVAREKEMWRAFVENSFHAAERMMKWRVIQHGDAAFDHDVIRQNYSKYVEGGVADPDLLHQYKQLKENYRYPGSYVDPGDHLDGIDEKEFKLDPSVADHILEVITSHRSSIDQ